MVPADSLEYRIIETAKQLFVERGYEKTSMSDIAAKVGISRPTLHYYFRTKEKMFRAVFGSIMESFLPRIQAIFDADMPLIDKFSKVLDEYIAIFLENPDLPRFILDEIRRDVDHLLDAGREMHFDSYLSSIGQVLMKEMEKGTIRKVDLPMVLLTFMSQVTFPFLSKNLVMALFYENEEEYGRFLAQWKSNVINQMSALLM